MKKKTAWIIGLILIAAVIVAIVYSGAMPSEFSANSMKIKPESSEGSSSVSSVTVSSSSNENGGDYTAGPISSIPDDGLPPGTCITDVDCASEVDFSVGHCNAGVCVECTQDSHCGIFGEGDCENNVCIFNP